MCSPFSDFPKTLIQTVHLNTLARVSIYTKKHGTPEWNAVDDITYYILPRRVFLHFLQLQSLQWNRRHSSKKLQAFQSVC